MSKSSIQIAVFQLSQWGLLLPVGHLRSLIVLSEKESKKGSDEWGEGGAAVSCLAAHKWEINTSASLMLPCV